MARVRGDRCDEPAHLVDKSHDTSPRLRCPPIAFMYGCYLYDTVDTAALCSPVLYGKGISKALLRLHASEAERQYRSRSSNLRAELRMLAELACDRAGSKYTGLQTTLSDSQLHVRVRAREGVNSIIKV